MGFSQNEGEILTEEDFQEFSLQALDYVEQGAEAMDALLPLDSAQPIFDQESGRIHFSNAQGKRAWAEVSLAGTYSRNSHEWTWSWAIETLEPHLYANLISVQAFGEKNFLLDLTFPKYEASEEEAYTNAAISAMLMKGKGIFRAPSPEQDYFFVIEGLHTEGADL